MQFLKNVALTAGSSVSLTLGYKITARVTFEKIFRPNCVEMAKTPRLLKNEVPPAGVAGLKTRRKVYWATVGNRRPNVVSLVIDNNSSFLARLRPLICHTYATQNWSTSSVEF